MDNNTIKTLRIKTFNEVHRSEIEIDPKIDLLDIESKTEIKVAANVAGTTSKSCYNATWRHFNPKFKIETFKQI